MRSFSWGDTVRVKAGAQPQKRPGEVAEVVGFREIENATQAKEFCAPLGSVLYLIEYGDGSATEIPEEWIEVSSSPSA